MKDLLPPSFTNRNSLENHSRKKVSVIVPVYKKADIVIATISKLYRILEKTCRKKQLDFELIVVIDGILDDSLKKLQEIQTMNLIILHYHHNRGKGFAVRYGMMKSCGDFVGFVDCGNDLDYHCISEMVKKISSKKGVHIVVGSKKHPDSKLLYPFKRKVFTWGYSVFTRFFTGIKYKDTQVGCKMFSRELLDKILPRILVKRFAFDVEILSVANLLGYTEHIDIPVNIDFLADKSRAADFDQIFKMMWDTLAVFYRLRILKYYHERNSDKWGESLYDLLSDRPLISNPKFELNAH